MADQYYSVRFRVNKFEFDKFKEAKKLGITHKMIIQALLANSSDEQVTVYDKKKKKSITLPKGFLCKK